ncbi:C40 family peptidase [Bacillus cereus]|uniref:NlpC/P60 family protein n=3 Tax=Bacillus cereus TaxID=1396 RepID=A0A9W7UVG3_BACCE|nr:C40 family peptidase [Bacillus cereus]KAB2390599.1 NlpC/P60 family protein [Bacillus cereus]KAB2403908.1 NlpC/P60 family protein [Bacillus cereus]MCU4823009.1 C40 family peptidase [Bacillus cereus]MCU4855822.1 C40 family peptidase [Bacillus cereus]MCU4872474.1 C40 family peptidase [Bacillus cereus]
MFKKGVSLLLILILSISTFSIVTHAASSSEYVNQSFYGYKEPSFNSAKTNGGSEYGAQNVGVVEKRDNGWWKIETWEGPVWINLNGEERVMGDFYAYDEPSLSSKVANAGAKYGRQTFRIVDGTTDGWLKFKTWEGDKWMNPAAEQITVNKTIYAYNEPSFNAKKANYGAPFNPQNWGVVEKKENGWMKVSTYEGYKWINPDGEERFINKSFYAYNEASFNAAKANAGALYNPQNFRVVDGTPNGWLKVKTWEGEKWLNPDGEERFINKSFYAYNEPSFSSAKANAGALYSPQNFRIIDGTTSGWLKIKTWEGDKWINLNQTDSGNSGVVDLALKQLGKPYVFGNSGPNSFDCSGFIYYVFKNNGYNIGRTSVAGYWGMVTKISDPQPGDLVFLQNTYKAGPSHLGIYLGNGEYIHAADETTGVIKSKINSSYTQKHFLGYARFSK